MKVFVFKFNPMNNCDCGGDHTMSGIAIMGEDATEDQTVAMLEKKGMFGDATEMQVQEMTEGMLQNNSVTMVMEGSNLVCFSRDPMQAMPVDTTDWEMHHYPQEGGH